VVRATPRAVCAADVVVSVVAGTEATGQEVVPAEEDVVLAGAAAVPRIPQSST